MHQLARTFYVSVEKNLLSQFRLNSVSSGFLSYAFVRHRGFSSPAATKENSIQTGIVKKIEPTEQGPILLVKHETTSAEILAIKVAGVQVDGNGFSWLQMLTTDKKIKFIPFINNKNECSAKIFLVEKDKKDLDFGRALVSLGFARATSFDTNTDLKIDASLDQYLKRLKSSENRAKGLRKGLWSFKPESWFRWKVRTTIEKLVFYLKPLDKKIPALIR